MEQWEAIIEHPLEQGHRSFEKILQTAAAVLNNASSQLAPFEIEWVMETLLYEPVQLLSTVASQRGDDVWRKACVDALKLLAKAVAAGCGEQHYVPIVNLCLLNYDAELRKPALQCLSEVASHSDAAALEAGKLVAAFEEAAQCRAPLAQIVGVLCEHHPAAVCDEVTRIWRGYLNMLENKKNTDTVIKAVLEGVCSLFRHFGDELPTAELGHLYRNLAGYIQIPLCQSACFKILRDHSKLFRERISAEPALRVLLWGSAPPETIFSVYNAIAQCVDNTTLKKILTTEVLPLTQSPVHNTRLTALRVLASNANSFGDTTQFVDTHTLEYEARRERVSRADAELILWCVEYNLPNSERLLQAAIVFYDNLPSAVRAKIVSCGILKSPPEVTRAAIQFLISHACGNPDCTVWRELSEDVINVVARQLAGCLATALENVSGHEEALPPKLSSLFLLASKMSQAASTSLSVVAPLLPGVARRGPAVLAAAGIILREADLEDVTRFYKSIRIDECRDEATLQEACLALVHAPDDVDLDSENMLSALQIIFSSDVEPSIHSAALKKLDLLLNNEKCTDLDIYDTIRSVEKLQARGDRTDKQIRILHREITLFLGKHGGVDVNNNTDTYEDDVIVDLKRSLALALPYQGSSVKVDLKIILLLAIKHGDSAVLQSLLAVLCANVSSTNDLATQRCIILVVRALAAAHVTGGDSAAAIQQAVRLCGSVACGTDLLHYITVTKSCGVSKLLSTAVSALCEEPATLPLERDAVMLASSDPTVKRAGLDIAETIITSLENNNTLSRTVLPELTVLIAKTYQSNTKTTFEIATKAFIDKKELFDIETIRKTVESLLENVLKVEISDVNIYKTTVKMTIEFIKKLCDVKLDDMFDMSNCVDVKLIYILAVYKSEFGFDNVLSRKIMGTNPKILKFLFEFNLDEVEKDFFVVEAILKFVEEYCEIMLELKYEETIQLISDIITRLTPLLVKQLCRNINQCFLSLNKQWKSIPKQVSGSFQTWFEKMPIKDITTALERDSFLNEHKLCVEAMKIMSKVFDTREYILSDVKLVIQTWPTILLKLYSSGRLEEYFMNEMSYFTDILTVSSKFLTYDNLKNILKGSDVLVKKNMGFLFCGFFIEGFFDVLTEKSFVLLDEDVKESSVVLNDIVMLVAKKTGLRDRCEDVLELVDTLWPTYSRHSTFAQKHSLLASADCLPAGLRGESNPLQWAKAVVCSREAVDERVKLLGLLPEETLKSPELTSAISSLFPARLRELQPSLLDAVAARPGALLPVVAALADDPATGWWDQALETCLVAVAKKNSLDVCVELFGKCHTERVCGRILVPLLRHSSTEICEKFLATVLTRILAYLNKRPKGDKATPAICQQTWNKHMIGLHLLQVAFEKLPTWTLESPTSALYSEVKAAPWHLVRESCKLVDSLRETRAPSDESLLPMYRKLQCMLYNTLSAGICRRRPGLALYKQLFNAEAFNKIVDENEEYVLPVQASWTQRNKSLPVAIPLETSSTLSPSRTQRSRIFLRTLSENPMLFDLHSVEEEVVFFKRKNVPVLSPEDLFMFVTEMKKISPEVLDVIYKKEPKPKRRGNPNRESLPGPALVMEAQEISLRDSPLNCHPCAGALTALCRHVAGAPQLASLWAAGAGAVVGGKRNVRWLLARIICNCKEELMPFASELLPGLLAVLTDTVHPNTKCMNGLHLDVLETILYWQADTTADLSTIAHHLITTCMELRKKAVFGDLVKTLNRFLDLYGRCVNIEWKTLETYYEDKHQDTQKCLLQIIKTISKNNLYVPGTLSKLLSKLDSEPSKMAECLGLALAACRDVRERQQALAVLRQYLEKCNVVTTYVRALYYACAGCGECCGEPEFRKITDYVTKVTSHDRTKCLHVLSAYLSRGRRRHVEDMFELVDLPYLITKDHTALQLVKAGFSAMDEALRRRCVAQVSALTPTTAKDKTLVVEVMLKAYEELFDRPSQPPAKRQRTDTTPLLSVDLEDVYNNSVLTRLGAAAAGAEAGASGAVMEALGGRLDKDLGIRFAECFLLTVYLPAHTDAPPSVCLCVSALLTMLYSDVRAADSFRSCRLRDEPLAVREEDGPSKLLTLSKTFQGTFSSYSATRRRTRQAPVPVLVSSLGRAPAALTPLYLHMCRVLAASGDVRSLLQPVERLRTITAGTEGFSLVQLLYEEVRMRCEGDRIFQLGMPDTQDVIMEETSTFTIEDLKFAFGKLSNWDDLTLQQRRAANNALPPLWTDRQNFVARLDSYEVPSDTECWFDKMAAAFKQEMGPKSLRWLKNLGRWPSRHFEISAITEATTWRHDATEAMPTQLFKTSECLAEWAARLMLRSAYYNSLQHSETDGDRAIKLSRSHELKWCMRANEMGIPSIALQCIDRNVVEELRETETLPWLRQKLLSLRQQARERHDDTLLRHARDKAEKYTPEYASGAADSIEMYHLMLLLDKDLKSMTYHGLQTILVQVDRAATQVDWKTSSKRAVSAVYQLAMEYYEQSLEAGVMDADSCLSNMTHVVCRAADLACPLADALLTVLLATLDNCQVSLILETAEQLVQKLSILGPNLDPFTVDLLEKNSHNFPAPLARELSAILPKNAAAEKWRRCLQLVCDPGHLLLHSCQELVLALRSQDAARWKSTFDKMKDKIYENPYAGPSFKLLDKYKGDLYGMYQFEPSPEYTAKAEVKLKTIIVSLSKEPQSSLHLADLCPLLSTGGTGREKWFGLDRVEIVKVYDKVQVFTDSIRRPVVLSMLLSDGTTRRFIQKTGEPLANDAAAQRVASTVGRLTGDRGRHYSVTLLDDETALIEYLEGHDRLRTLIGQVCDLDVLQTVSRPADQSLLESPAAALLAHDELCSKVPAHALRSALELNSSSVQDFISKKRNFTESLADSTVLTWLLGLGDRHLQNILCSRRGHISHVDWGHTFRRHEPPRLSRCLLAAGDTSVLEARLQRALQALRDSAMLLEADIRVAFRWMGPALQEQLRHVRGILRGVTSSYGVTRDVIAGGRLRHKEKYLDLLDSVLGEYGGREEYSVEDQVSCLLRHCTAPELLSVIRAGWEPWV